jgi:GT2 family glycosyltransferase
VGGFDPRIFLYFEDDDLMRRLADTGASLVHVHAALATHAHGRSSAPEPKAEFRKRWHFAWSRCYISAKWGLSSPAWRLIRRHCLKALIAALTLQRGRLETHCGTVAGAVAYLLGRSALQREGVGFQSEFQES